MKTKAYVACGIAVVSVFAGFASAAQASGPTWLTPVQVSPSGTAAWSDDATMSSGGNSAVTWDSRAASNDPAVIQAASRIAGAGNSFSAAQNLSSGQSGWAPQVAEDQNGDAIAVWVQSDEVMSAWSPAGSAGFGTPTAIDGKPGESDARVAIDSAGDAIAVWTKTGPGGSVVEAAFAAAGSGGAFGAPVVLSNPHGDSGLPAIDENAAGDAIVVWVTSDLPWLLHQEIQFAYRPSGTGAQFGPAEAIDGNNFESNPVVTLDGNGNASAAWLRQGPPWLSVVDEADATQAQLTASTPGFGTPTTVGGTWASAPEIAGDAAGDVALIWTNSDSWPWPEGSTDSKVVTDVRLAGGSFAAKPTVLGPTTLSSQPQIGLDDSSDAVALWQNDSDQIEAAVDPGGAAFGSPTQVSQGSAPASDPTLGIDSAGDATAAWLQGSLGSRVVMAAGFDPGAGPTNRDLVIPTTGTAGSPVTFSVSPFDVWSPIVSVVWNFGDGTPTASGDTVQHTYPTPGVYNVTVTSTNVDGNSTTSGQKASGNSLSSPAGPGGGGGSPRAAQITIQPVATPAVTISHITGAAWNSNSPATSMSSTVTVPAVSCTNNPAGTSAGQQAGLQMFGTETVGTATVFPSDFVGVYTYCSGTTGKYAPEFAINNPSDGTVAFQPAGFSVSPGDPLMLSVSATATGVTMTITDVNTKATATVTGAALGTGAGWEAGLTPIVSDGPGQTPGRRPAAGRHTGSVGGPLLSGTESLSSPNALLTGPVPSSPTLFNTVDINGQPLASATGLYKTPWTNSSGATVGTATSIFGGNQFTAESTVVPTPTIGSTVDLAHVSGNVFIKLPGSKHFVKLQHVNKVPLGTTIDSSVGYVQATLKLPKGLTQTGVFYHGIFKLAQSKHTGATTASLAGGTFADCPQPVKPKKPDVEKKVKTKTKAPVYDPDHDGDNDALNATTASAKKKKKGKNSTVRSLWSNAHGNFSTKGSYGAAAVLGTQWLTQDRCDGTYFQVTRDKIAVTVYFPHKHTVIVTQGHHFLAPSARYAKKSH